jgi:hypothetical protein
MKRPNAPAKKKTRLQMLGNSVERSLSTVDSHLPINFFNEFLPGTLSPRSALLEPGSENRAYKKTGHLTDQMIVR